MTKINRLSMKGFKSFANKVELVFGEKFNCILGPNGSGKCVTGDTKVQLSDGSMVRIDELVNGQKENFVAMEDGWLALGDDTKVISLGSDMKLHQRQIQAFVKRKSPENLITIKTRSGKNITATPYHPLFILKNGKVTPARADELKEGIRIAVPRRLELGEPNKTFTELLYLIKSEDNIYVPWSEELFEAIVSKKRDLTWKEMADRAKVPFLVVKSFKDKQSINFSHLVKILKNLKYSDSQIIEFIPRIKGKTASKLCKMPWENSSELSRLLGYLLAEGRLTDSNHVWFTNADEELIVDYRHCMKVAFDLDSTVNEYKTGCWDVITYSVCAQIILEKFGMGSKTEYKKISNLYFEHSGKIELSNLINGLYCGDGYVSKSSIEIVTKSIELANGIETALLRIGLMPRKKGIIKVNTTTQLSGKYVQINLFGKENFETFSANIDLKHNMKANRVKELLGKKDNTNVDLIEVHQLVKDAVAESNLSVKGFRKNYPVLEYYVYNQCLPSRKGINTIVTSLLTSQNQTTQQLKLLCESDIFWDEITELEEKPSKDEWVYDLCVAQDHNFIANNIIVHNSNVLDSLCFVLGKSSVKELRAEKSANLIYNGGKKSSPAKEGMVSIFFDNKAGEFGAEYGDELDITRIIKPNGQSVYKINQKVRTRQQILDLLSKARINPDGYNIILQGDITRMIEMSQIERRGMVEEIAGINVYEDKKQKAIRELTRVEEKTNEAGIILNEREGYLKDLKKEKNQAQKFKELSDKIKQNKATSIHRKIVDRQGKQKDFEKKLGDNSSKIEGYKKEIENLREDISKKKKEIEEINHEVEQKGEKEQVEIHKQIEKIKVDVALNKQRIITIESEIKKIEERKTELGKSYSELSEKIAAIDKQKKDLEGSIAARDGEITALEKKIAEFRKKNKLEDTADMENKISEIDKKAESLQEEIQKLREEQQNLFREEDRLKLKIQSIDEKIMKVLSIEKENKEALEALKKKKAELEKKSAELEKAVDYDTSLSQQLGQAKANYSLYQEEEAKLRAKSASIQESVAGGMATAKIMELKNKGTVKGIIGSVSELGHVKEEYALALEVAAGPRLGSIVVETDETAAKCIRYLKDNKLGTATFLPLNKLKVKDLPADARKISQQGVRGLAIDIVSFSEKYRKVFEYVFGSTLVVDDVETARKIGVGSERMVTLTGDLVETSGAMQGGFRQRKKGIGFQDKEVEDKIKKLESEIRDITAVIANVDAKKKNNEMRIDDLRHEKGEFEGEVIKLEKALHLDSSDLGANKKEKETINAQINETEKKLEILRQSLIGKNKELAELKIEKQKVRDELMRLRSPALLAELNSFEQKKQQLKEETMKLNGELRTTDSEKIKILGPEGERIQKILKQNDKEKEDFAKERKEVEALIKNQEKDLEEKEKRQKVFYAQFKSLFQKRNKLSDEITKIEGAVIGKEGQIRELDIKTNGVALENAGVKAEITRLQEEFKQYEGVPLFKDKSEEEIDKEIKQFERMMSDIGAVNMKALEIYDKAESEYNSLLKKKEKLSTEREDVLVMINEIEVKKKELFLRTYNVLNDNFKRIFGSLTTKGEASFELENEQEPFQGGMTLKVRLVGTKFLDIRSLSGGEKTLTALAFLFAVQEYAPASFYVMDEVDAALDKNNSEKLAKTIRRYCENAQYVVISHNDSMISEADNLYGVSMDESQISKVTSLKV